jgi:hypothetical protein
MATRLPAQDQLIDNAKAARELAAFRTLRNYEKRRSIDVTKGNLVVRVERTVDVGTDTGKHP